MFPYHHFNLLVIDLKIYNFRLELLDVSFNKLTEISEVCGSSGSLKHLNISNNLIIDIPEWIISMENVRYLDLSFNPLDKLFSLDLKMAKVSLNCCLYLHLKPTLVDNFDFFSVLKI